MSILRRLLDKLMYGGSARLRPYEEMCLKEAQAHVSGPAAAVFDEQVRAIQYVQRFSNEKLTVLFFLKKEREIQLFANRAPELRVGRLTIEGVSGKKIRCHVVCHEGRLSTLEFSRPPRPELSAGARVAAVEILEDLLAVEETRPAREGDMVRRLREAVPLSNIVGPAAEERLARFPELVSAPLPEDYAALLRETDGFVAHGWEFLGTRGRRLVLPDATLYVTAEDEETALCLREGESQPRVFIYDQVNDQLTQAPDSWLDAFLSAVRKRAPVT